MFNKLLTMFLALFLGQYATAQITGFGVQFGTGPDTGKVFIIQESIGAIPEGGYQLHRFGREFTNKTDALELARKQLASVEGDLQRSFKLREDLYAVIGKLSPPPAAVPPAPYNGQPGGTAAGETKPNGSAGGLPKKE